MMRSKFYVEKAKSIYEASQKENN